jgi:hypothetical protein
MYNILYVHVTKLTACFVVYHVCKYVCMYHNTNVSREGLAPIVKAYSRLIPVDGLVL